MNKYLSLCTCFILLLNLELIGQVEITGTPVQTCATGTNCSTVEFAASGISSEFSGYTGDYRIFWSFGDGSYADYFTTIDADNPITFISHTFTDDVSAPVYMEAVPTYENDKPPKRFQFPSNSGPLNFVFNCTPSCESINNTPSGNFFYGSNRNFVKDHKVSYLLSFVNTCTLEVALSGNISFEFNDNVVQEEPGISPVFDPAFTTQNGSIQGTNSKTLNWTFIDLQPNEVRHIIIPLEVLNKEDIKVGQSNNFTININMNDQSGACAFSDSVTPGFTIKNSHDPNNLGADQDFTCYPSSATNFEYVIRFRNDGDGAATNVIIKDIIPDYFDLSTIETTYPFFVDRFSAHTIQNGNEAVWNLSGTALKGNGQLRGTKEKEYGTSVFLTDCVDSIVFKVSKKTDIPLLKRCEAIVNQAEIIFDCNHSFYTEPYIFRLGCLDTISIPPISTSMPILDTVVCVPCSEGPMIKSSEVTFDPVGQKVDLEVNATSLFNPTQRNYTWYPSTWIDNNDFQIIQPKAGPIKGTNYFLVAHDSDNCERTVYQKKVNVPCDLNITTSVICSGGVKTLNASVVSNSGNLIWQDCLTTGNSYSISGMNNEYLYLSVVDQVTGCYATKTVKLSCPSLLIDKSSLIGFLVLVIALAYVLHLSGWWP